MKKIKRPIPLSKSSILKPRHLDKPFDARRRAPFLVALALLAVIPYLNALTDNFVYDDFPIIVDNPLIRDLANVGKILTTDYWGVKEIPEGLGVYRPLALLSYALDYAFWDLKPFGYHFINVALHTINTLLFFGVAFRLTGSLWAAFAAGSIFAVHPIHTEAVTSVVGRAELLASLFFLLAFSVAAFRTTPRASSAGAQVNPSWALNAAVGLLYFLGLLSKESAITLPAVLLVYDLKLRKETGLISKTSRPAIPPIVGRYWALAVALLVYLSIRASIVTAARHIWIGFAAISNYERVLTASRVLMEYLALLIFPRVLSADYWKPEVPIAHSMTEPQVLLSMSVWVVAVVYAVSLWRKFPLLVFSMAWFFVTVLPMSNLLFTIGVGKAERILYLPSMGFCLLAAAIYVLAEPILRRKWLALIPLLPILILFGTRTYVRNSDWKDNLTLALATLKVAPTSLPATQIAAAEYRKRHETAEALPLLEEVVRQRPDGYTERYNLANAYLDLKQYDEAIASYREAIRLKPDYLDAMNNMGRAQNEAGKTTDAIKTYTTILSLDRNYLPVYLNLASVYLKSGDFPQAARVCREGLAIFPNSGGLHMNLAIALNGMGQAQQSAQEYQRAITLDPSLKR
ncbi:MAG TPA: tetratricopeptide repeat protein [Acidobacteriota bacterium]